MSAPDTCDGGGGGISRLRENGGKSVGGRYRSSEGLRDIIIIIIVYCAISRRAGKGTKNDGGESRDAAGTKGR